MKDAVAKARTLVARHMGEPRVDVEYKELIAEVATIIGDRDIAMDRLKAIETLVREADRHKGSGFDTLASATWDAIVELVGAAS